MASLTQSFWIAVAPPILVAEQESSTSRKTLSTIDQSCAIFVLITLHSNNNDDPPFIFVRYLCFRGFSIFGPIFFGAPVVYLVLELRK